MNTYPGVRAAAQRLSLADVLQSKPTSLDGVSDAAAGALEAVGILTIFDLGGSRLFMTAIAAIEADAAGGIESRFRRSPSDWFRSTVVVADKRASEQPIVALADLDSAQAAALTASCGITTVADLAAWPPFRAARALLGGSLGESISDHLADDPAAQALRPRLGEYPVERVYYDTLVLFDVRKDGGQLTPIEDALPLPIAPALDNMGFRRIGVGARLSLCQSWTARGVTLGNLLHSLALAPGEATRMAVLDWTRKTRANTAESIDEREELSATLDRARATKEIQDATATDAQSGFSQANTSASSESGSVQAAVETGLLTSLYASGGVSGAYQFANSSSQAQSVSFSQGTRTVMANMEQHVNDRTEQHASSARSRRASIVREVSENEHATASTRIVANYNHMHALTVQYWEVVQVYEISTVLRQIERVLFVPVQLPDVTQPEVLKRFRIALAVAALTPRIRDLLLNQVSSVGIKSIAKHGPGYTGPVSVQQSPVVSSTPSAGSSAAGVGLSAVVPFNKPIAELISSGALDLSVQLGSSVVRPGSDDRFYPDDAMIVGVRADTIALATVRFERTGNAAEVSISATERNSSIDLLEAIPLGSIRSLSIAKADEAGGYESDLYLKMIHGGRVLETLPIPLNLGAGKQLVKVANFYSDEAARRSELEEHLKANAVYYGQQALRSLDPPSVALLLGGYELDGVPLAKQIDPTPIGVTGNWLVLRAPTESDAPSGLRQCDISNVERKDAVLWHELLEDRAVNVENRDADSRIVPMPTGGVFAEAVLGRSNSAERLDITRFWNWQDSPIPLAPTDIVPPDLGSRARDSGATPSQLGAPVLNVMTPPAAPEPAGLSAVLNAVANGAMFRDMSGLAGTQQLAQAGQQATIQAGTDAGLIASSNMRTQAQKAVAMAQVAADIVKAALGAKGGGSGSNASITEKGAQIAHGQSLDRRGAPGPDQGPSGSARTKSGVGETGTVSDGGGNTDRSRSASGVSFANEQAATGSALGGTGQALVGSMPAITAELMSAGGSPAFTLASDKQLVSSVPITTATDPQLAQAAAVEFFDATDIENYFRDLTGQTFAGWFTSTLSGRGSWGPLAMSMDADTLSRFAEIWNVFPSIIGTDRGSGQNGITLPEFSTLMAKFLHETGGRLQFRGAESVGGYGHPGLSYAFESFDIQRPGEAAFHKGSYNTSNGNHTAFKCFHDPIFLAAFGTLEPTAQAVRDRNEWNGTTWPVGVPTNVDGSTAFVQEADFYKCRGRGGIQSTGRAAYLPIVEFVRTYAGVDSRITAVQQRWSNLAATFSAQGINLSSNDDFLTASSNADWDGLFTTVTIQAVAILGHNNLSGKHYLPMSGSPVVLRSTGRGSAYFVAIAIAGNNPSYGNDVQRRMLDFIGTLWNTPMPIPAKGTIEL